MVRWLERELGNMPVDVPFNDVDLREQEQDFCFMHSRSCHMSFVVYGACAGNTSEAPKRFAKQAFGSLQGEQSFSVLSTDCL